MVLQSNMPPRNSRPRSASSSSGSACLRFCMLCFAVILLFKVDVFISETRKVQRRNIDASQLYLFTPMSFNNETFQMEAKKYPNATFYRNFVITWGDDRAKVLEKGELLTLRLDQRSGSGFESKHEYLFGKIDMQLKLVAGNSAGTVTTYYLSSEGSKHDEIDFEFLGNASGEPYTLHTNVFSQGQGNREQQFFLWFDPTADFHKYSILWNPQRIIFYVDDIPIREFKNYESIGVPFPKDQPMKIYSSLWNADDWATQGGRVKTDWSLAPFIASYRNFSAEACVWSSGKSTCSTNDSSPNPSSQAWFTQGLDLRGRQTLRRIQKHHMVYNYCTDKYRFPEGPGPECKRL